MKNKEVLDIVVSSLTVSIRGILWAAAKRINERFAAEGVTYEDALKIGRDFFDRVEDEEFAAAARELSAFLDYVEMGEIDCCVVTTPAGGEAVRVTYYVGFIGPVDFYAVFEKERYIRLVDVYTSIGGQP